jgi:hypothetical protein
VFTLPSVRVGHVLPRPAPPRRHSTTYADGGQRATVPDMGMCGRFVLGGTTTGTGIAAVIVIVPGDDATP